ncbi:MAG: 23S rRNA (adenine(2503)-C(2))-methyltransferase RlmN [Armatimonadetes bacterium]|nr:23S rRNA (adenine(2503)-C(2))-methyltransferase RlmN [Armatimonadota bacterium]
MEVFGAATAELERLAADLGEPPYRGRQIAGWLYRKNAGNFSAMTDLPAEFRRKLEAASTLFRARTLARSQSADGTTKFLLELSDGQRIESALIPYTDRVTVCVSTQVGCAADCSFCATAAAGLTRNLSGGEIVDQVLTLQGHAGERVTNVVFMGMGEPLLNYDEVIKSVRLINSEVGIAMRKMTISTVGITPRIRKLQSENLQLTLAISLHAPDDDLRRRLIPLAQRYPLNDLIAACRAYAEATGRRVTYEYLLLAAVNDSLTHARKLVGLIKGSLANVNLIPYNTVFGKDYKRPQAGVVKAFRSVLQDAGIETTERFERGHAVSAACGQLSAGAGSGVG